MAKFLKFKEKPLTTNIFLGNTAINYLKLSKRDQLDYDKTLMQLCTDEEMDPNSDEYKQASNHIAMQLALLNLDPPKPRKSTQEPDDEDNHLPDLPSVENPINKDYNFGSEDTTILLSEDSGNESVQKTPRSKLFASIFKKQ
jgi:hypothetical protein